MDFSNPLITLGHPVLRQRSHPVSDPSDPHIQRLIDHLLMTMHSAQGVGIAAPQLGYSHRLLVVASRPNPRYPQAPLMEPKVMLNPRIIALSETVETGWEGCLSVPGIRGKVPRASEVEVEYWDRWGQHQRVVWQGFVARIFQHEYDHLEGQLFLDRVVQATDLLTEAAYQNLDAVLHPHS